MATANPFPLTRSAFSPYGAVIEAAGTEGQPANDGRALRFDQPLELAKFVPAHVATFAIYTITPSVLPMNFDYMERHPASCQVFLPMNADRFLAVVAGDDADGGPCLRALRAFIGTSQQGVCYRPGVWHTPLVSLGRAADFAMFMWRSPDAGADCEIHALSEAIEVSGGHDMNRPHANSAEA